jgi:hypothetical protein
VESNEKWCPWNFRTRLREGAGSTGVNFNGAFTIVTWGCGTECQSGGVIDRSDGRVYELPIAELGYEFYSDSSLLVVNPDPEDMYDAGEMPEWLSRRFYHFRNGTFVLVHEDTGDAGSVASILDTPHPVNQEVLEGIE